MRTLVRALVRTLVVARKSLLELVREPQLLLLVLLIPLAFLGIAALSYSTPLLVTHPVLVLDGGPESAPLKEGLKAQRYADGRPVFDVVRTTDPDRASVALGEKTATALVTLSPESTTVTITGNALYARFYRASILLENVIYTHADRAAGRSEIVRLAVQPLGAASPQTEFDIYAPGMIIFALLLIVPQTAMLVAREIRWHTLRRLRLTRLRARDFLGGISLAQLVVAIVQVVTIFVGALLVGFHNQGSLAVAIAVGLVIAFSAIGQGLVVACFIENDSQAINVGSMVGMLQVFLSGSFYQLPPMTIFSLGGHQIDLFDVFPATHGFLALKQVLSYGAGLREIAFRLGATLVLSLLYFGVGVAVFQRLRMQRRA
jgi:ABC-2 type transport system permease protein